MEMICACSMDNFEGRYSADAHTALVKSASDSNINTLRVWGGGALLQSGCMNNAAVVCGNTALAVTRFASRYLPSGGIL